MLYLQHMDDMIQYLWYSFKCICFIDSLDSFDSDPYGNENNQNIPNTIHSSSALNKLNNRAHNFTQKSVIIPEICGPCGKKYLFCYFK